MVLAIGSTDGMCVCVGEISIKIHVGFEHKCQVRILGTLRPAAVITSHKVQLPIHLMYLKSVYTELESLYMYIYLYLHLTVITTNFCYIVFLTLKLETSKKHQLEGAVCNMLLISSFSND